MASHIILRNMIIFYQQLMIIKVNQISQLTFCYADYLSTQIYSKIQKFLIQEYERNISNTK